MPYPTVESEMIEHWENLIAELKNHVTWWKLPSERCADHEGDTDEDHGDDDRNADDYDHSDRRRHTSSKQRDAPVSIIVPEPTDEQFEQAREILRQLGLGTRLPGL